MPSQRHTLRNAYAHRCSRAPLAVDAPLTADGIGALAHADESEALLSVLLGFPRHAAAVVPDGKLPMGRPFGQQNAHRGRFRVPHGVAYGFLGDAEDLVFVLRRQPGRAITAFEGNGDAAPHGRAFGELPQGRAEATA